MIKEHIVFYCSLVAIFLNLSITSPAHAKTISIEGESQLFQENGLATEIPNYLQEGKVLTQREKAQLLLPDDLNPLEQLPLIVSIHGLGANHYFGGNFSAGTVTAEKYLNIDKLIQEKRFMLLVPEGVMKNVNDAFVYDQYHGSDHCPVGLKITL